MPLFGRRPTRVQMQATIARLAAERVYEWALTIAEALGKLKDARAITPLVTRIATASSGVYPSDRQFAAVANDALAQLAPYADGATIAAAVNELLPLLDAAAHGRMRPEERDARNARAEAPLKKLAPYMDHTACAPLVPLLRWQEREARRIALETLQAARWQPADDGERAAYAMATGAWDDAARLGPVAIAPLLDAVGWLYFQSEADARLAAQRAVVRIGPPAIDRMLAPDLEELLCFLVARKITRINLNAFRPIGRCLGHAEWAADAAAARAAVRRAWARCFPDRPMPEDAPEPESCSNCGVGSFLNVMPNGDVFPCHVLTRREFRCGNVREQSLVEICRRGGLLGHLAALDFRDLAAAAARVADLTRPQVCMGNVYAATKTLPVWRERLPLIPVPARAHPVVAQRY